MQAFDSYDSKEHLYVNTDDITDIHKIIVTRFTCNIIAFKYVFEYTIKTKLNT